MSVLSADPPVVGSSYRDYGYIVRLCGTRRKRERKKWIKTWSTPKKNAKRDARVVIQLSSCHMDWKSDPDRILLETWMVGRSRRPEFCDCIKESWPCFFLASFSLRLARALLQQHRHAYNGIIRAPNRPDNHQRIHIYLFIKKRAADGTL